MYNYSTMWYSLISHTLSSPSTWKSPMAIPDDAVTVSAEGSPAARWEAFSPLNCSTGNSRCLRGGRNWRRRKSWCWRWWWNRSPPWQDVLSDCGCRFPRSKLLGKWVICYPGRTAWRLRLTWSVRIGWDWCWSWSWGWGWHRSCWEQIKPTSRVGSLFFTIANHSIYQTHLPGKTGPVNPNCCIALYHKSGATADRRISHNSPHPIVFRAT